MAEHKTCGKNLSHYFKGAQLTTCYYPHKEEVVYYEYLIFEQYA